VASCEVPGERLRVGWPGPSGSGLRGAVVFVPRKFQAKPVAGVASDLWGYLVGGREQTDYYLGADGTPTEATARLHGRLWARRGLARLGRGGFGRLAGGPPPPAGPPP